MPSQLQIANPAILPNSLILVTGANGFIGSHIADQFLAHGYRVRGTVRSESKLAFVQKLFDSRHGHGRFSGIVIEDMAVEGAYNDAMEDCAGVAHVASDMSFGTDPNLVITPVVQGIERILATAGRTPSVKRFVLTSSSSAATEPKPEVRFHVDANTWNEESSAIAWAPPPYDNGRNFSVYSASKVEAERAAWAFLDKEKPRFVLNTVLPNFNIGPILSSEQIKASAMMIRKIWQGDQGAIEQIKMSPPQYWVNVVDDAKLHVAAMVYPDVKSERLLAFAEPFNYNDIVQMMNDIAPDEYRKKLPQKAEGLHRDLSTIDTKRSLELLRRMGMRGWTSFEQTIREACSIGQ